MPRAEMLRVEMLGVLQSGVEISAFTAASSTVGVAA